MRIFGVMNSFLIQSRASLCMAIAVFLLLGGSGALAGQADVENVKVERAADGSYSFHVTVRHADTGWDHYANAWSLSGISIPEGISKVIVRARDSQHGEGGRSLEVELP